MYRLNISEFFNAEFYDADAHDQADKPGEYAGEFCPLPARGKYFARYGKRRDGAKKRERRFKHQKVYFGKIHSVRLAPYVIIEFVNDAGPIRADGAGKRADTDGSHQRDAAP